MSSKPTSEGHWTIDAGDTLIEVKAEIDDETKMAVVVKLFIDNRMVSCVVNRRKEE